MAQAGRFGPWGGRYVPETLMAALEELELEYERAKKDPRFKARLSELLKTYAGRPTPLFYARRMTQKLGGAKIYLKREDLLHNTCSVRPHPAACQRSAARSACGG